MTLLQPTLFDGARNNMRDSIRLAIESLEAYGSTHAAKAR